MTKYACFLFCLCCCLVNFHGLGQGFPNTCQPPQKSFTGKAPAPWAIDGELQDWQTVLIPAYQGNWSIEELCLGTVVPDKDSAEPVNDLELSAFLYDDYNVHFYFRRDSNGNSLNTVFYFIDIDHDSYMNTGEPVISVSYNSATVVNLSLGYYVPNTTIDYVAGKGNPLEKFGSVDGYTMVGTVKTLFNSKSLQSHLTLNDNEVFAARVTEDGYGVEFAIPWTFLKNWTTDSQSLNPGDTFFFHLANQAGGGTYTPERVTDNMGGCCGLVAVLGEPSATLIDSTSETIISGQSYKFTLKYLNTTNTTEIISLGVVTLENITGLNGQDIDESKIRIIAYKDTDCNGLIDDNLQPINYVFSGVVSNKFNYVAPLGNTTGTETPGMDTACFIVEVLFDPEEPVAGFTLTFNPVLRRDITFFSCINPTLCGSLGDGGKPISPVGFSVSNALVSTPARITELQEPDAGVISVYPNPSTGSVMIALPQGEAVTVNVLDNNGRLIRKLGKTNNRVLSIQGLRNGVYYLQIVSEKTGKRELRKVLVQR